MDGILTEKILWTDFNEKENRKIAYTTFCRHFKKLNIGFSVPSQDDCDLCSAYKDHGEEFNLVIKSLLKIRKPLVLDGEGKAANGGKEAQTTRRHL